MFILKITCTNNNYFLILTTKSGSVIFWTSAGTALTKGIKKQSPAAIDLLLAEFIAKLCDIKIDYLEIYIRGTGPNLFILLQKLIKKSPINISKILFENGIPHNGCKPPAKRRI